MSPTILASIWFASAALVYAHFTLTLINADISARLTLVFLYPIFIAGLLGWFVGVKIITSEKIRNSNFRIFYWGVLTSTLASSSTAVLHTTISSVSSMSDEGRFSIAPLFVKFYAALLFTILSIVPGVFKGGIPGLLLNQFIKINDTTKKKKAIYLAILLVLMLILLLQIASPSISSWMQELELKLQPDLDQSKTEG